MGSTHWPKDISRLIFLHISFKARLENWLLRGLYEVVGGFTHKNMGPDLRHLVVTGELLLSFSLFRVTIVNNPPPLTPAVYRPFINILLRKIVPYVILPLVFSLLLPLLPSTSIYMAHLGWNICGMNPYTGTETYAHAFIHNLDACTCAHVSRIFFFFVYNSRNNSEKFNLKMGNAIINVFFKVQSWSTEISNLFASFKFDSPGIIDI